MDWKTGGRFHCACARKDCDAKALTHDLIKNMAHNLKMKITRVAVTEILDNTFYALIYLNNGKDEISIDSQGPAMQSQLP